MVAASSSISMNFSPSEPCHEHLNSSEHPTADTRRRFSEEAARCSAWAGLRQSAGQKRRRQHGAAAATALHALPHFAPKAKRAIYLFMAGAPSQFETWDYKPKLPTMFDKDLPESVRGGQVLTGMTAGQARLPIAPSCISSSSTAKRPLGLASCFPGPARCADELAIIKSVHTDAINHEPAILLHAPPAACFPASLDRRVALLWAWARSTRSCRPLS